MSSWAAEIRRREATLRREEREVNRRQRERERLLKEHAELTALEAARLEADLYDDDVHRLQSVHHQQGARIDWTRFAAALLPLEPLRAGRHEFSARIQQDFVASGLMHPSRAVAIDRAQAFEDRDHQAALNTHLQEREQCLQTRHLAERVLAGDAQAYADVLSVFTSKAADVLLGASARFTVHSSKLLTCELTMRGQDVVPQEAKTLTATGKLSVKAMPKGRGQELYQAYVCGCVWRAAREAFALLPVSTVLVTAFAPSGGHAANVPVLSVAAVRAVVERLAFKGVDPAAVLLHFLHHGDAKGSARGGGLPPIVPLTPADLIPDRPELADMGHLLAAARQRRAEIAPRLQSAVPPDEPDLPATPPPPS